MGKTVHVCICRQPTHADLPSTAVRGGLGHREAILVPRHLPRGGRAQTQRQVQSREPVT